MHIGAKKKKIRIFRAIPVACLLASTLLAGCTTLRRTELDDFRRQGERGSAAPSEWFTGDDPLSEYRRSVERIQALRLNGTALISLPDDSQRLAIRVETQEGRSEVEYRARYGLAEGRILREIDTLRHLPAKGPEVRVTLRGASADGRNGDSRLDGSWVDLMGGTDLFHLYRLPAAFQDTDDPSSAMVQSKSGNATTYRFDDGTRMDIIAEPTPVIRVAHAPFLPSGYVLLLEGALPPDRIGVMGLNPENRSDDGRMDWKPYLPQRLTLQNAMNRTRLVVLHEQAEVVVP